MPSPGLSSRKRLPSILEDPAEDAPGCFSRGIHVFTNGDSASVYWKTSATKLKTRDKVMVSDGFEIWGKLFRLMLTPKEGGCKRYEETFRTARGRGYVELKCHNDDDTDGDISFEISVAVGKQRKNVVTHDFSTRNICKIASRDDYEAWDYSAAVDPDVEEFVVSLEIKPSPGGDVDMPSADRNPLSSGEGSTSKPSGDVNMSSAACFPPPGFICPFWPDLMYPFGMYPFCPNLMFTAEDVCRVADKPIAPPPGLYLSDPDLAADVSSPIQYEKVDGCLRVSWSAYAKRLTANCLDTQMVSPDLHILGERYRLILKPRRKDWGKGQGTFYKAHGQGSIELKYLGENKGVILSFRTYVGKQQCMKVHDFSAKPLCSIDSCDNDEAWNFLAAAAVNSNASFIVSLEVDS